MRTTAPPIRAASPPFAAPASRSGSDAPRFDSRVKCGAGVQGDTDGVERGTAIEGACAGVSATPTGGDRRVGAGMSLYVELQRRNVIRIAGLYLVGAWLVVQVAATLLPVFEAPSWVMRVLVSLLAIGFVAALVFAWAFELTPDGLKRDAEVVPAQSMAPHTARRIDRTIIMVLLLGLGYFAFDKFVLAPGQVADGAAASTPTATGADAPALVTSTAAPDEARPADAKSIAVLAFADLSQAKDQEYFSDGVAEEILNALAKVDELKVVGRTSSFYFKGRKEPLATIGSTLGVAHVLEGSVRKQGERLRISAKLVRVSDGLELWAETFEGTDADIFALQESIARQVASELKVALNAGQQGRLVDVGTRDPDAYALYLRATDVFNRRAPEQFPEALAAAEQALQRDPRFARAQSRLATLYYASASVGAAGDYDSLAARATDHAQRALQLDATLAEPHAVLAMLAQGKRDYAAVSRELELAQQIDADDPTTQLWSALPLCNLGYIERCEHALDRVLAIDPMVPNALGWRARLLVSGGDLPAAERMLARARDVGLRWTGIMLSSVAMARGDRVAARAYTRSVIAIFGAGLPPEALAAFAGARVGDPQARAQSLRIIDRYLADRPPRISALVPMALVWMGETERGLALFAEHPTANDPFFLGEVLGTRLYPAALASQAFPGFLRKTGIAAYWDEFGPPGHCRKFANGDYRCD